MKNELVTSPDGSKFWYKHGILHREHGPAMIYSNGIEVWYLNAKLIKVLYEGKEYKPDYDPCNLCLVKPICNKRCKLKKILSYN